MESLYSLRRACRLVRMSPAVIGALIDAGVIAPARNQRGVFAFSFRDLALLRGLAGARPRALKRGAGRLAAAPGRRLVAHGARSIVVEPDGSAWDAESGQLLIDFDIPLADTATVVVLSAQSKGGATLLDAALALETDDPTVAIDAYRRAIAADRGCEEAYLGLGALLEARYGLEQALETYLDGVTQCPGSALLHFNCAVGFQLLSAYQEAEHWYHAALALDPALADAHHNLSLIYMEIGDEQRAIRHHNELRRLEHPERRR